MRAEQNFKTKSVRQSKASQTAESTWPEIVYSKFSNNISLIKKLFFHCLAVMGTVSSFHPNFLLSLLASHLNPA